MPAPKYSQETLDEAARLRETGLSLTRIAEQLSMSPGAVYWHCLRLGADAPKAKPLSARALGPAEMRRGNHVLRRFTAEEDARLLEMEATGARVFEIARALKRKPNSVRGRMMTLARHEARQEEAEMAHA